MNLLRIKFILSLCLAVFTVQEGIASLPSFEKVNTEFSVKDSTDDSTQKLLYFDDANILKTEFGTKYKIPIVFVGAPSKISMLHTLRHGNPSYSTLFLRDQKKGIKILIFPFHSFW